MAVMSRIFSAIILFIEFKSILSLTGYQIQEQERQQQAQGGLFAIPNGGPTFDYNPNPPFNPNLPQFPTTNGRIPPFRPYPPSNGGNLIIHNPYIPNPNNIGNQNRPSFTPPDVPKPDIPTVEGPPIFTFNPQAPYQPPGIQNGAPLPPPPGSRPFDPSQMNPFTRPIPRPNPVDPQISRPNPGPADPQNEGPEIPQSKQPEVPPQRPQPEVPSKPDTPSQSQSRTEQHDASGPVINSAADMPGHEAFVKHGGFDRDDFLYSTQAQVLVGTLAAFFSLCALIRCYSKCCWDRPNKRTMNADAYQRGAAVTRHNTNHIEADIDWSDHTENEDDPLDDYDDDNAMTDVQQMRSRKARELVPDESIDSGIYSNADDRSLDICQADVELLMEEEDDINNKEHQLTDDETKAIMKEFKDTDDEYVD